jgi:hypothetical protein
MKNIILLLVIVGSFAVASCEKEGDLTQTIDGNSLSGSAILRYSGNFSPTDGIEVSGSANIYRDENRDKVRLEDFGISDGPDLKVYLSKTALPHDYVNLGALIPGKDVYLIPVQVDVAEYQFVLIHCQQYNHMFAVAELTPEN